MLPTILWNPPLNTAPTILVLIGIYQKPEAIYAPNPAAIVVH